ncbi:hypothetical protein G5B47_18835 [Paenibacillus sp. 7124]|uniref:DUF4830 domain-containing protein n=2 Tax=Paenibacillus apii TaxID=1850370 RepID=A0A6M1PMH2_9BACL|nr:hypothetical protein [Paenibacillus apii]NJJ40413.1 hypothetical protein [Paenibacillus apii]
MLNLAGCGKEISRDENTAKQYITAQGYKITSSKGEVSSYILDKGKLIGSTESTPYRQAWGVQKAQPDAFFGKRITIYRFTVSNHPLEQKYKSKTNVYIMLCEGRMIGGYSFPDIAGLLGAPYSLNGLTLEEVTGLGYQEWLRHWEKKYGD